MLLLIPKRNGSRIREMRPKSIAKQGIPLLNFPEKPKLVMFNSVDIHQHFGWYILHIKPIAIVKLSMNAATTCHPSKLWTTIRQNYQLKPIYIKLLPLIHGDSWFGI